MTDAMKALFSTIFLLVALSSFSQVSYNTGNTRLDADLNDINARASINLGAFKTDIGVRYDISEKKLEWMFGSIGMSAGDVFIAVELGKLSKKPIEEVVEVYSANKGQGWGNIAKQLGIKPGSPEFHQLKNNASAKKKEKPGKGNSGKGNSGKGKGKKN